MRGASSSLVIAMAIAACGPRPGGDPAGPVVVTPVSDDAARAVTAPTVDAAPVPLPLDRDMPALAARMAELYRAAGDAMVAAGKDCGRASAGLGTVRDQFRDVRDAVARVVADGRTAQLEPELDRQREPIAAALARMQPTLDACRADAKLDEALEGLAGGGS